jgi:hypothetical protein
MGKTQQTFAVEVMKTSIGTIARWETSDPPRSEVLDQLASIAYQHKLDEIGNVFLKARLEETKKKWSETKAQFPDLVMIPKTDAEPEHGYLFKRFNGRKALELANVILLLEPLVSAGYPEALKVLSQASEVVKRANSENLLAFDIARAFTYAAAAGLPEPSKSTTTKATSRKTRK